MTAMLPSAAPPRISDFVLWHAALAPERPALVLEGEEMSYEELSSAVDALAKALLAAGVGKGDRVATLQTPRPEFVVAWLAASSIGAIWVGLNPRYRTGELAHVVRDAEPKVLLTRSRIDGRDYFDEVAALSGAGTSISKVVVFDGDPPIAGAAAMAAFIRSGKSVGEASLQAARSLVAGHDPCAIVYTSGSTGAPKGALLHHHGIGAFAIEQNRFWPVEPHRNLNFLPINHVGCLCDVMMPCLAAGGTLFLMEQFDPERATRMIDEAGLTIWGSVPTVFGLQMATESYRTLKAETLQLIVWEGAAMPSQGIAALLAHGVPMATNYSMTESVGSITAVRPTREVDLLDGTVGEAFAGVEIRLLDERGEPVPEGGAGEVAIRSPYLFAGYWRRPEETADAFTTDGFFRTGDVATRGPDGLYRLVGRLKEMYKSGGYNVYPREIETVLEAHPAVAMAAVVSIEDPLWQEVGVAFVLPQADIAPEELRAWCAERVANYKVPKRFVVTVEMPMLPVGKVDKVALRREALSDGPRAPSDS